VLKSLIIAALFALLLLLLYSRLFPYIQFVKKILGVARTIGEEPKGGGSRFKRSTVKVDGKLVRCVSCGTWIPAERAIGTGAGLSVYCSRECLEKSSNGKERKIAG
jgi:hypothetical protein